jgi:hypothetical protein
MWIATQVPDTLLHACRVGIPLAAQFGQRLQRGSTNGASGVGCRQQQFRYARGSSLQPKIVGNGGTHRGLWILRQQPHQGRLDAHVFGTHHQA